MTLLRVFIGYDPRQPLAYNVLQHSIVRNSTVPVSITPLILSQLPTVRTGLTEFTYTRFLVPYLCRFAGRAVFLDADMVVTGNINDLFEANDGISAVSVMHEQPKFERASLMVFNCGACIRLTPDYVNNLDNKLFDFSWAPSIGSIPKEWSHCVGYQKPAIANLYHYTQGLPCWHETSGLPEDTAWLKEREALTQTVSWFELMGKSVHAEPVIRRMLDGYGVKLS